MIPCDAESATLITQNLGVEPTPVRESKSYGQAAGGGWEQQMHHTWMLDSPKSHTDGDPTARLYALADTIQPLAARLPTIRPQFPPWVDIVYHITPQHPHGIKGEFDWFRMPAELMRRFSEWDLGISYEVFWFDHPDWVRPKPPRFWSTVMETLRWGRPDKALQ